MNDYVTITEAAELIGVPYYKLIYLERVGKIPKAQRNTSNHRMYSPEQIKSIKLQLDITI